MSRTAQQTWWRRGAIGAAVAAALAVMLPAAPASALPPAPSNIVIELDGSAATKTMALTWATTSYTPFNSYEIFSGVGAGTIDWYDYLPNQAASSYSLPGAGVKTSPTPFALGSTYSVGMDIAEGPGVAGPKALADVKMVVTPTVTVTSTTASSLTISWTAAAASDPFVSYDIFVAPSSYGGSLASCWSTWESVRTTTTKTLTTVPAACGGGSITKNTTYKVGVRTVQRTGNPSVWTKIGETTAKALVPQCNSTNETFCSDFPNAFVKTRQWPIAEQGAPFTLNGVNSKYGPQYSGDQPGSGTWNTTLVQSVITQMKGAGGPTQLNTVRVNLDWGMFQYKTTGGSIAIDTAALTELDAVIDTARANGVYVILVPIHLRQPGSACLAGGKPRLLNATFNVPAWAWAKLSPPMTPGSDCANSYPAAFNDKVDDVVAITEARTYLRTLAARYSDFSTTAAANRSKTVVAIDLVNEMPADGANVTARTTKVLNVYKAMVDDLRTQTTATSKIFVVGPSHGDTSLALSDADLDAMSAGRTNIVLSLHDYFGGRPGGGTPLQGDATYGKGYGSGGWKSTTYQQFNDTTASTYTTPYATEAAQHREYLQQYVNWAAGGSLPVFVGEYGVWNPCAGNSAADANQYATDTKALYNSVTITGVPGTVALSRTWFAHGFTGADAAMDLRRMSGGCASQAAGTYYAHAANL